MAVVLLVIGALMSGAGVYAVIFGYSIIQVEEGWASVISGATLFAGGVVTIALGLLLRVLKQVQTSLLEPAARVVAPITAEDPPLTTGMTNAEAPILAAHEPAIAGPVAAQAPEDPTPAAKVEEPIEPLPISPGPVREPFVPMPAAGRWSKRLKPADAQADETPPSDPSPIAQIQEPPVLNARPADDYKLETPSTAEHDLPAAEPHPVNPHPTATAGEPPSPAMDDWLDRAFAELDRDNPPWPPRKAETATALNSVAATATHSPAPQSAPERSVTSFEPASTKLGESPQVGREQMSSFQPDPTAPEPQASPTPPTQSAVIGRYESDGTTYVMFADGSIEAQSEAGIYRFASMAELKTYIEK